MATVTIDDQLQAEFQAISAPDEDFSDFLASAAKDAIARRKRQATAHAEAQAALDGPRKPFAEADADFRRRHGLSDYRPKPQEERADEAERTIAAMDPKVREEMKREGLL